MLSIEGPRFSSRAESLMFRQWGADVINMTTVPEVVLAKEAGLCYASIAMATDYDCWKEHEEAVSVRLEVRADVFITWMSLLCLFVACVSHYQLRVLHDWCTSFLFRLSVHPAVKKIVTVIFFLVVLHVFEFFSIQLTITGELLNKSYELSTVGK